MLQENVHAADSAAAKGEFAARLTRTRYAILMLSRARRSRSLALANGRHVAHHAAPASPSPLHRLLDPRPVCPRTHTHSHISLLPLEHAAADARPAQKSLRILPTCLDGIPLVQGELQGHALWRQFRREPRGLLSRPLKRRQIKSPQLAPLSPYRLYEFEARAHKTHERLRRQSQAR